MYSEPRLQWIRGFSFAGPGGLSGTELPVMIGGVKSLVQSTTEKISRSKTGWGLGKSESCQQGFLTFWRRPLHLGSYPSLLWLPSCSDMTFSRAVLWVATIDIPRYGLCILPKSKRTNNQAVLLSFLLVIYKMSWITSTQFIPKNVTTWISSWTFEGFVNQFLLVICVTSAGRSALTQSSLLTDTIILSI